MSHTLNEIANSRSILTETDEVKLHRDKFYTKLQKMFDKGQLYKTYKHDFMVVKRSQILCILRNTKRNRVFPFILNIT